MGKKNLSALLGAAFLMATSSIGPGFLTQTATFTEKYKGDFAFVILISIVLTIGAQVNAWRVIGVSGMRAQDISNKLLPGLGYFVAFIVALGGLAFNIGNVGGAAMGLNVVFGLNLKIGALISAILCIGIFLSKEMGKAMDKLTVALGGIMILLVAYVAIVTKPPVSLALARSVMPENIDFFPIITLIGGTVGGYITFSGGHRLIDAGITGQENIDKITKSSSLGILVSSIMRILLFLAVLGVVYAGNKLDPANPPASAFNIAAGNIGYKFFGVVIAAAAITSVVGAAYTSVSFLKTLSTCIDKNYNKWIIGFILVSTIIFITVGQPVKLLILAGSLNGLILPITLAIMLIASVNKSIVGDYKHPLWLLILGIVVVIISAYAGGKSLMGIKNLFI
ncbi:Mn2+/Fe2+ NRAMP family transporter [Clostridium tetanomorphum]|uniref:Divalent metal cation transporter n=2 Tax=Clostridium tetanomorphum TaxID=1553 RepID=A0A923J1G7_CLOTT|nr:NRAMP family divalent metal transporter [Clostridium tetanomorphum]KAJ51838.1 branched chain amino acid transport system II carrier protein [Clostridium tetanomorphum DSM 665]MBC2397720.1 divalent metal cation transporter [Clostridium tetanomorphum]MBP1865075.1 Mn2+/Fe2+ NRAMP family transporter [Clostridium tetanomorphum]NRS83327.1 Mn2+/Fe2+ NRAMP family transporter [Clostridium tetanomorphum]NRZ96527.1 Mn2+/Fe2+ NRAMP family transporter [Clostridium tetanomorphum]